MIVLELRPGSGKQGWRAFTVKLVSSQKRTRSPKEDGREAFAVFSSRIFQFNTTCGCGVCVLF